MDLLTRIDIPESEWKMNAGAKVLLVGSCFADEIGEKMVRGGFDAMVNPFGTLYNPLSIAQALTMTEMPELIQHEGLWHAMSHHGSFSCADKAEAEQAIKASIQTMQQALQEATVVIVTFGTAWVYEMKEIVAAWRPILERYPDKHWLFTVSPIRHIKDGLHENQLSKATLLQAVEQLGDYFPSYEIMLDELRDYRFYADDLVHPSSLAVNYIFERFADTFCNPQTRNEMTLQLKRWKQSQHRPLH